MVPYDDADLFNATVERFFRAPFAKKDRVKDFLKSFEISVESFKGTVQLSGFVDSQKAIDKADEIARSVKGVTYVKNDLIVK